MREPRILALDIETLPIEAIIWQPYDVHVPLDNIEQDWTVAAWAAKWVGEDKIYYADVSKQKNKRNEREMLRGIWKLIKECDVLLTQNGIAFDLPKLNAKFIEHGYDPLPEREHIDTKRLAKGRFKFTSSSLAYLCKVLKTKHQKLEHKRFPGIQLWKECLRGNKKAWADMKEYNIHDIICLEEVYEKLKPWGLKVNLNKYRGLQHEIACNSCGSQDMIKNGFFWTAQARYQRYSCKDCGAFTRGKVNLLKKKAKK